MTLLVRRMERQSGGWTGRQEDGQSVRRMDRQVDTQAGGGVYSLEDGLTDSWMDGQSTGWTDK